MAAIHHACLPCGRPALGNPRDASCHSATPGLSRLQSRVLDSVLGCRAGEKLRQRSCGNGVAELGVAIGEAMDVDCRVGPIGRSTNHADNAALSEKAPACENREFGLRPDGRAVRAVPAANPSGRVTRAFEHGQPAIMLRKEGGRAVSAETDDPCIIQRGLEPRAISFASGGHELAHNLRRRRPKVVCIGLG